MCSSGIDPILDAGYSKAIASISLDSKQELTNTLVLHYTLYRNKVVLDQLRSGLQVATLPSALSVECLTSSDYTGDGCG